MIELTGELYVEKGVLGYLESINSSALTTIQE